MTAAQINSEILKVKGINKNLLSLVKQGKKEYYQEYIDGCAYLLQLTSAKPNHDLKIA